MMKGVKNFRLLHYFQFKMQPFPHQILWMKKRHYYKIMPYIFQNTDHLFQQWLFNHCALKYFKLLWRIYLKLIYIPKTKDNPQETDYITWFAASRFPGESRISEHLPWWPCCKELVYLLNWEMRGNTFLNATWINGWTLYQNL